MSRLLIELQLLVEVEEPLWFAGQAPVETRPASAVCSAESPAARRAEFAESGFASYFLVAPEWGRFVWNQVRREHSSARPARLTAYSFVSSL